MDWWSNLTSGQTKSPKSFPGWKAHFLVRGIARWLFFGKCFFTENLWIVIERILFAECYHHICNFCKTWAFCVSYQGFETRFVELNNPTLVGTEWNWNNWRNVKFQKAGKIPWVFTVEIRILWKGAWREKKQFSGVICSLCTVDHIKILLRKCLNR